ncbi:MAG: DUF1772 domain-containing protein [Acidimicrobiia bacterium]|nr:MAG: DUF1772 domain-containing protein [Acidimicrobiia bacterium]
MIDGYLDLLVIAGAVGAGLNAGVFYAFSTFVMQALGRLPSRTAVEAMQAINIEAPRPGFMVVFMGTAVVSVILVISAFGRLDESQGVYQVVGSGLYLAGFVVTGMYHVPRNNALAQLDPGSDEASNAWNVYLPTWTRWNHVRTLTSLSASVILILSLLVV